MSIEKKFLKTKPVCKLKFQVSGGVFDHANSVSVAGDFNGWSKEDLPLKRGKDGSWSASIDLESNRDYQFRYVVDGNEWVNEPEADLFIHNGIGEENSVVSL